MKKVFKIIVFILFAFIAIPFLCIYSTIEFIFKFWNYIYRFLNRIYNTLSDLEEKIISIK